MAGRAALLAVPCTRGVEIRIQPVNGRDELEADLEADRKKERRDDDDEL
jgi:hypothetical protein